MKHGVLIGLLATLLAAPGWSAGRAPEIPQPLPKVVIFVDSAGSTKPEMVAVSFFEQVDHRALTDRISRMASAGKLKLTELTFDDSPLVVGERPATAASFKTGGLVSWPRGLLALDPFIQAFSDQQFVRLVYRMGNHKFQYRGWTDYRHPKLSFSMESGEGNYVFDIHFKGADLAGFQLPPPPRPAVAPREKVPADHRAVWLWLGLTLIAAGGGLGAFAWRRTRQEAERSNPLKGDPEDA